MRLFDFLLIGLIPLTVGKTVNNKGNEISNRLDEIDLKFKSSGASLEILDDYDVILNDIEKLLSSSDFKDDNNEFLQKVGNTRFRHGLINLILKREKLAYNDFHSCIVNRNDKNQEFIIHNGCFENFSTLGLKLGNFNQVQDEVNKLEETKISKLFNKKLYEDTKQVLHKYADELRILEDSIRSKNWDKCIGISNELLRIGSNDDKVLRARIQCLLQVDNFGEANDDSVSSYDSRAKLLSEDYNKLVNEEVNEVDLNDYVKLGEMELFGITGIYSLQMDKILRNCLKIDNEFEGCRNLNKVYFKLNRLMKLIKDVSIYYSFVYSNTDEQVDNERVNDTELSAEEWKELASLLFDESKRIKIKNASDRKAFGTYGLDIDKLKTNFEIVVELFLGMSKQIGFEEKEILDSSFLKDIFKLSKEAYYQIGEFSKFKDNQTVLKNKYYKEMKQRSKGQKDVVDYARQLESYLKKKKVDKARELLESLPKSMRLCRLIKERQGRLEEMMREEGQHRRQQQQQHQFYQQQQQQQQPAKPFKPKNDYYKALGVSKDADADEIKKAYRQKMKENHPDKVKQQMKKEGNPELSEEEIETRVAEINNAYEILSDEEKRANYDRHGEDPNDPESARRRQQWQQQQNFRGAGHGGGFQFQGFDGFDGFPGFQGFPGFNGNMKVKFGRGGSGNRR